MRTIETRVLRRLRRCGRLTDLDGADSSTHDPSVFDTMHAAAILGVSALGPRQGRSDPRLRQDATGSDFDRGKLCANSNGFSLRARVDACNNKRPLEKLIRYAARPPIVPQRLTITENGPSLIRDRALYSFKRACRNGSTHIVLEQVECFREPRLLQRDARLTGERHGDVMPGVVGLAAVAAHRLLEQRDAAVLRGQRGGMAGLAALSFGPHERGVAGEPAQARRGVVGE